MPEDIISPTKANQPGGTTPQPAAPQPANPMAPPPDVANQLNNQPAPAPAPEPVAAAPAPSPVPEPTPAPLPTDIVGGEVAVPAPESQINPTPPAPDFTPDNMETPGMDQPPITPEPVPMVTAPAPKKGPMIAGFVITAVVAALVAGGGVWFLLSSENSDLQDQVNQLEQQLEGEQNPVDDSGDQAIGDVEVPEGFSTFEAADGSFAVSYPDEWGTVEEADNIAIFGGTRTEIGSAESWEDTQTSSLSFNTSDEDLTVSVFTADFYNPGEISGELFQYTGASGEWVTYGLNDEIGTATPYNPETVAQLSTGRVLIQFDNGTQHMDVVIDQPNNTIYEFRYSSETVTNQIVDVANTLQIN